MPKAKTAITPPARREFVNQAYSDEFLRDLSLEFEFDALTEETASEIRMIGRRYLTEVIAFDDGAMRTEARKRYQRLKGQIRKFEQFLNDADFAEIESDLYWAALRSGEPAPQTDFPQLTEFEKTRGAPYWAELKRLLLLLDRAAVDNIRAFAAPRGRKKNGALENIVRRCAFIWEDILGRRFSLDYQDGHALTAAGQFVIAMVHRLDPAIPEQSIITAMRSHIALRNRLAADSSRAS